MADKKPSKSFITPRGGFVYPKLSKPDTKFKAEGEYRVKLRVKLEDIPEELHADLIEMRDAFAQETQKELTAKKQGAKVKTLKVRDLFPAETDKDSGEETGFVLINAKMNASGISKRDGKPWTRSPKLFDAKGKKLATDKVIWGGTEGKLAVQAVPYYTPKDNEVGVSFYLEAAQILKLVSGSDKDAAGYGFGEEEGYTDEPDEGGEKFAEEKTSGEGSTAGAADDF